MISLRSWLAATVLALGLTMVGSVARGLAVPSAPSLAVPIVDQTNTLTDSQITSLAGQIATSREQKSYQIGILIIPTLGNDEYLEGYSLKVAREWAIGDKTDNGVLVLVVMNDRKLRIEVGRGLEGDLTDIRASRIIRDVMTPQFRNGNYYGGLSAAVDSIQRAVSKQADPKLSSTTTSNKSSGGFLESVFYLIFFVGAGLSWLSSMLARSKSWWGGGIIGGVIGVLFMVLFTWQVWTIILTILMIPLGLLFDFLVSRNYQSHKANGTLPSWWAGGGNWTSGSGGGFSGGGFGGGGFSGGGASGGW